MKTNTQIILFMVKSYIMSYYGYLIGTHITTYGSGDAVHTSHPTDTYLLNETTVRFSDPYGVYSACPLCTISSSSGKIQSFLTHSSSTYGYDKSFFVSGITANANISTNRLREWSAVTKNMYCKVEGSGHTENGTDVVISTVLRIFSGSTTATANSRLSTYLTNTYPTQSGSFNSAITFQRIYNIKAYKYGSIYALSVPHVKIDLYEDDLTFITSGYTSHIPLDSGAAPSLNVITSALTGVLDWSRLGYESGSSHGNIEDICSIFMHSDNSIATFKDLSQLFEGEFENIMFLNSAMQNSVVTYYDITDRFFNYNKSKFKIRDYEENLKFCMPLSCIDDVISAMTYNFSLNIQNTNIICGGTYTLGIKDFGIYTAYGYCGFSGHIPNVRVTNYQTVNYDLDFYYKYFDDGSNDWNTIGAYGTRITGNGITDLSSHIITGTIPKEIGNVKLELAVTPHSQHQSVSSNIEIMENYSDDFVSIYI